MLFGGLKAASATLQSRLGLPDASVEVLMGIIFVLILLFETLYGRLRIFQPANVRSGGDARSDAFDHARRLSTGDFRHERAVTDAADVGRTRSRSCWRSSPGPSASARRSCSSASASASPRKSGRVNLGLEGTLVMGAMTGFAVSYLSIDLISWLGWDVAALASPLAGRAGGRRCRHCVWRAPRRHLQSAARQLRRRRHRHDDLRHGPGLLPGHAVHQAARPQAARHRLRLFLGQLLVAQRDAVHDALHVNVLFLVGVVLAPLLAWMLRNTRWGLMLRLAGESEEAAAAMGYSVNASASWRPPSAASWPASAAASCRCTTPAPGPSRFVRPGLMAVALVIFARWNPMSCLLASLLFGGVGSVGLALQGDGPDHRASTAYLWNTAPYVLTLVIMILTSFRAPGP